MYVCMYVCMVCIYCMYVLICMNECMYQYLLLPGSTRPCQPADGTACDSSCARCRSWWDRSHWRQPLHCPAPRMNACMYTNTEAWCHVCMYVWQLPWCMNLWATAPRAAYSDLTGCCPLRISSAALRNNTYIHACIHTHIHIWNAYIYTYIHTFIHICMHSHMHTYMHTYIHTK